MGQGAALAAGSEHSLASAELSELAISRPAIAKALDGIEELARDRSWIRQVGVETNGNGDPLLVVTVSPFDSATLKEMTALRDAAPQIPMVFAAR